jgi:hypothetical protein
MLVRCKCCSKGCSFVCSWQYFAWLGSQLPADVCCAVLCSAVPRYCFESDVPINMEGQEALLDWALLRMGLTGILLVSHILLDCSVPHCSITHHRSLTNAGLPLCCLTPLTSCLKRGAFVHTQTRLLTMRLEFNTRTKAARFLPHHLT